jgi:hypothetical protein
MLGGCNACGGALGTFPLLVRSGQFRFDMGLVVKGGCLLRKNRNLALLTTDWPAALANHDAVPFDGRARIFGRRVATIGQQQGRDVSLKY